MHYGVHAFQIGTVHLAQIFYERQRHNSPFGIKRALFVVSGVQADHFISPTKQLRRQQ